MIGGKVRGGRTLLLTVLLGLAVILPSTAVAQSPERSGTEDEGPTFKAQPDTEEAAPDQIIVKFKENASSAAQAATRRDEGLEKKKDLDLIGAEVDKVRGQSTEAAIRALERRPEVEYATQDRKVYATGYADEPHFGQLWGLHNTGQTILGSPGTSDMDVNAKEASALTQGDPNLVVAVIDTGVAFSHPDLTDRAWKNPGESGSGKETNGVDDDANGFVDDVTGADFYNSDGDPFDDNAHGTHVSGTIAASVNDQGVVGVAPNIKIMALKFLNASGSGFISDAIDAIGYAKSKGAKISNNSWGYLGSPDPALRDAVKNSGQLFVAAAGNESNNNDANGFDSNGDPNFAGYPGAYNVSNVFSIAAINNRGDLAGFSNFGATSVDISAPGVDILSSVPGGSWQYFSGTSMAAPHATGAAALAASQSSGLLDNPVSLKQSLMDSGKPVSATAGSTITGDMIDAKAAATPPAPSCTITGTSSNDTLSGTSGKDVICGLGGNDTLKALGGDDVLIGGEGNDTLFGGLGTNKIDGGPGTDTASYSTHSAATTASLTTNTATGLSSDTFVGIENLIGSPYNDTLTGSSGANKLTGGGGSDTLRGRSGNDTVIGSGGADKLYGEDGNDTVNSKDGVNGNDSLDGGAGTDTKVTDTREASIVGFP